MSGAIDWAQFPTIGQARAKAEWAFAEIASLRAELAEAQDEVLALRSRELYVTAERDRLRAELANAIEALETIASLDNEDLYHGDVDGKPTNTATQIANAALAPRPPEGKGE
jgi:chromosome segregation ATPase